MSQQYCILAFRKNEFRNNKFYPLKKQKQPETYTKPWKKNCQN